MQQTVAIARQLTRTHPQASLPCPACAASLKAVNLERHLLHVHQIAPQSLAPPAAALELVGVDRRSLWLALVPGGLWLVAAVVCFALPRELTHHDSVMGALGAWLLTGFALPLLVAFNVFRARLSLDGSRVRLRYAGGLLTHELALPATLQTGSIWQGRPTAGSAQYEHSAGEDVRIGSYLRLSNAGRSLTIGCTKGASPKKRWAARSFQPGPKRRHWDITLDAVACVALEYHLAAQNLLSPD